MCVGCRSVWIMVGLPSSGSRVLCRASAFRALPTAFSCTTENLSHSGSQVLRKDTDSVRHVFCVLSRSKQLRQPGAWQTHCPRWAMRLNHLPSPTQSPGCAVSAPFQVWCVSSGELISGREPPGRCQPSRIPGRCG